MASSSAVRRTAVSASRPAHTSPTAKNAKVGQRQRGLAEKLFNAGLLCAEALKKVR